MVRRWAVPSSVVVMSGLLLTASPPPTEGLRQLRDVSSAADPTAPVVAALTLAAQALVLWLAVATVVTAAGHVPGLAGRVCGALARVCVPAALRRALEIALGVTVTVGTLTATPALAVSALPTPHPATASAPDLDWPVAVTPGTAPAPDTASVAPPSSTPSRAPSPDPGGSGGGVLASPSARSVPARQARPSPDQPRLEAHAPSGAPPRATPPSSPPRPETAPPMTAPPVTAPPVTAPPVAAPPVDAQPPRPPRATLRPAPPASRPADVVVVQPGDTLWDLAAAALAEATPRRPPTAAAIARAWPQWWAVNREVIGDDPDLLLPGAALTPPDHGLRAAEAPPSP